MRRTRPFSFAIALSLLLALLVGGAAFAQTSSNPAPDEDNPEPSAYLTLDMQAGFVLDPFLVSLNGGGEVDASTLDPACVGYINDKPVMTANWSGAADFLRIFFYSDSDSTLVIQQPDGSYVCADDVDENVLDAEVTTEQPAAGTYKIWVGSYEPDQLIPGLLVITGRQNLGLSSFDPRSLVKRAPLAVETPEPPAAMAALSARAAGAAATAVEADSVISAETTITATVVASGTVPSFTVHEDAVCGGVIGEQPDYVIDVEEGIPALRILFEADQDSSLVVVHGEGDPFCADDSMDTPNANPVLDLAEPEAGLYRIYVGRFHTDEPITGTLTITTDPTVGPAILAPAANPQE